MSSNSVLTNPESVRANQNGQITNDQMRMIRSRLSGVPGVFTVALLFGLLILVALVAGNTLSKSTPLAIAAVVVIIIVTFVITSFIGNILGSLRMAGIRVEQVPGQVIWDNNRYSAISGGQRLDPITYNLGLQPGDYTFYRVHGKKFLLSAQPAAWTADFDGGAPVQPAAPVDINTLKTLLDQPLDFDPRQEPEKSAQRLAQLQQAFKSFQSSNPGNINPAEAQTMMQQAAQLSRQLMQGQNLKSMVQMAEHAEALAQPKLDYQGLMQLNSALEQVGVRNVHALKPNQAGQQSAPQRFSLIKEVSSNTFWAGVSAIVWLVISYLAVSRKEWTVFLVASVLWVFVLIALVSSIRKELGDLLSGRVQVEEGWVTKTSQHVSSGRSSTTYYYYMVNQQRLQVSSRAYNAMIEGNYRVYYLPKTRDLVNIDPVS